MKNRESWQLETDSAKFYEQHFVPALFAQWAPRMVRAAQVKPGDAVLDVATGTGLVARFADNQVEPGGSVVGYDLNPGMLAVAARVAPHIQWSLGPAEKLPFEAGSFDAVTCQFGLMFFQDRVAAAREMYRVLKPGRTMAIAVWDKVERSPGYAAFVQLLEEVVGANAADILRAPFDMGNTVEIEDVFQRAGLPKPDIQTLYGTVRFPSIEDWIECDIMASPIKNLLSADQFDDLQEKAQVTLKPYTSADGSVLFDAPVHFAVLTKQG